MKIVAIEFSSERRSVAVLEHTKLLGQASEQGGPGTRSLALVERALDQAGMEREQIECLAVGLGPGSYAGIRIAIALAQGWQLARGVRLLGVPSVEALVHQAQAAGLRGRLHLLVDAQRNEFYTASYQVTEQSLQLASPLRLITAPEADTLARQDTTAGDPHLTKRWPHLHALRPDAAVLGQLAAARTDFVSGESLQPIYLRETNFVKAPPPRTLT